MYSKMLTTKNEFNPCELYKCECLHVREEHDDTTKKRKSNEKTIKTQEEENKGRRCLGEWKKENIS